MLADVWPWAALAGLGAFHGLNPAMGWLFAVALGLHRRNLAVVLASLLPLTVGHLASAGLVALAFVALGLAADPRLMRNAAGLLLIGWAIYHYSYGHRHRVRVGMTTGMAGLVLWSFTMATVHGAGLMLVPVLMPLCRSAATAGGSPFPVAIAGLGVHTAAMLATTGIVAIVVYEWIGVAFLRYAWFNIDLVWSLALAAAGLIVLFA
ncbi:MAG: hypothetical protein M3N38_02180 [Pseudomonadota bacterium]|nr:hypothetical protein [Pseudomonadota bacterium]